MKIIFLHVDLSNSVLWLKLHYFLFIRSLYWRYLFLCSVGLCVYFYNHVSFTIHYVNMPVLPISPFLCTFSMMSVPFLWLFSDVLICCGFSTCDSLFQRLLSLSNNSNKTCLFSSWCR